jgi:hypothetical protein
VDKYEQQSYRHSIVESKNRVFAVEELKPRWHHERRWEDMKTANRQFIRFLPLLLTLILANGCVTKALWENGNLEAFKEPGGNPNLRVFDAKQRNDLLVVYDEHSERNDSLHTRAYWLKKNQARVDQQRAPHFTGTNLMCGLPSVPIFHGSATTVTNPPLPLYAVVEPDKQSFALYTGGNKTGSYDLPVYNDGWGRTIKITLTPVAVTTDVTIVGGFIGYLYLEGLAQSDYSVSVR